MSGHVIYACPCLNIKIHLSSKYSLKHHATERQQYWFQEAPIAGWHFDLGMGAVVAYSSLIQTRTSTSHPWMTVGCLNCDLKNVYSVYSKMSNRSSSGSLLVGQSDESVVIHEGTLFGSQLDDVRNDDQFSTIFDIKLSNLISPATITHQNEVPEKLRAQHQELRQVLEKALDKMRLASEVRIEQWKRVEMERLEEDTKKAKEESSKLWQKVLSVNHVETQHPVKERRITGIDVPEEANTQDEQVSTLQQTSTIGEPVLTSQSNPATNIKTTTNDSSLISSTSDRQSESKRSQSHVVRFIDNNSDPTVSSLPSSYRRSSFSLNQSAITNSLTQQDSLLFSLSKGDVPQPINDSSSDDEDMFDLDEELQSDDGITEKKEENKLDDNTGSEEAATTGDQSDKNKSEFDSYGTSWIKKKKFTGKYIVDIGNGSELNQGDDNDITMETDENEDLSQSISKYATSMPININSGMGTFIPSHDDEVIQPAKMDPTNVFYKARQNDNDVSSPFESHLTSQSLAPTTKVSASKSFIGYDFSFSDRALSKQFPDYNPGRRKSVATIQGRRQPQLDALIENSSLDTRTTKK
ncbi:uncharacterized protein BX664DRAFT_329460 [Halteromyces radiatus]|uniref:uncharacterized protein n=1 Tax=Halteromyces radiatus TaxID=101107 RepID=UPI00221F4EE0|nr:uncharacterized protein BX664DRAFT_329460 [Halteromyces radiatus]KAI8093332.1 hypothetical protein BX664DRAFT_329460 [Halteromyces radiatus]